jgi:hypothetical protein
MVKEGAKMRLSDSETHEIVVERDAAGAGVALQIGNIDTDDSRVVHLTSEEARRLAALILFQTARLERPGTIWRLSAGGVEGFDGGDSSRPAGVPDVSH